MADLWIFKNGWSGVAFVFKNGLIFYVSTMSKCNLKLMLAQCQMNLKYATQEAEMHTFPISVGQMEVSTLFRAQQKSDGSLVNWGIQHIHAKC